MIPIEEEIKLTTPLPSAPRYWVVRMRIHSAIIADAIFVQNVFRISRNIFNTSFEWKYENTTERGYLVAMKYERANCIAPDLFRNGKRTILNSPE
jgi:hypothetical protein